jgi:hypothetical protein
VLHNKRHGFVGYVSLVGLVGFLNRLTDLTDLTVITGLTLLLAVSSHAATITATSCSQANVQSAINSAAAGDTVSVPAGNCTWTSQVVVTKGILLQGAGAGSTVITCAVSDYALEYEPANPALDTPFRLTGFTFDASGSTAFGVQLRNYRSTFAQTKIRIDHNTFKCSSYARPPIWITGNLYGVADSNTFEGQCKVSNYGQDGPDDGIYSWTNFTYAPGTAASFYWEDNVFNNENDISADSGAGGRYVFRYNTINLTGSQWPMLDAHGNMGTNDKSGTMGLEVYGNRVNAGSFDARILDHRGGRGLCFDNYVSKSDGMDLQVREEHCDNLNAPATASDGEPQHVSSSYYWSNYDAGGAHTFGLYENLCAAYPIAPNVDYWDYTTAFNGSSGTGCGPLASRPATCTTGVGYWATTQSCSSISTLTGANSSTPISGTLYKCTAPNTWTSYYTPYTYPHPLRTAAQPPANAVYIGQTQSGAADGSSCANARALTFFNAASNWGSGAVQIGAGKTVFLCGTVTGALTLQGSGASGNPVTIDGSAAALGAAAGVNTNNKSGWKLVNLTWADGANTTLINVTGGSNGLIENAHADAINDTGVFMAQGTSGRPDTITVRNSFFRTGAQDYGNTQHDIITTEGSLNVVIEGNYLEMRAGGAGGSAHDDVIQTWESGSSASAGPPGDWTIRYNRIVMNSSASNDRSWTMLENLTGTNYIYGNVFLGLQGAGSANGLCAGVSGNGAVFYIQNNTFVAKGSASNNVVSLGDAGTANLRNNIFHLQNQTALTGTMTVNRSNNHWFGSSIPSCSGVPGDVCGTNPNFADYANNDFSLQSTSIDKGAGANLGPGPTGQSFDSGIAAGATWPNPGRLQRSAPWDRGAYVTNSGGPSSACDLNGDSASTVSDVQLCVNQAIGTAACGSGDINKDSACNVVDVQRTVNGALGGQCVTQ